MESEQLYASSRRKSRTPSQIKPSSWHSVESPDSRDVSPFSRDSSTSSPVLENQKTEGHRGLTAQHQERHETYSTGSDSGSSSIPLKHRTQAVKGDGEAVTSQYTQFDIKNTYAEDTLGIIPMPVEVGSPSSLHSDEEDEQQTKRFKLSQEDDQHSQGTPSEYNNSLNLGNQAGMFDAGGDRRDSMMRKVGKTGEGKSAPRTVILPMQREALERLWQVGMKSTSRKLRTLQEQAQQETGLRMDIIHVSGQHSSWLGVLGPVYSIMDRVYITNKILTTVMFIVYTILV